MTTAVDALRHLVGDDVILCGEAAVAAYGYDLTGRFSGQALAVAVPRTAEQVASILGWCDNVGVAVVPQGGLVGGATPRDGELVLSLRRLVEIGEVDPLTGLARR